MKTAVDELIEKIQLEYDAAEKAHLENKSRESYIALRCFQLCRTFAKEAKEMEKKQIKDAYLNGRYDADKIVMSDNFYAEQYYNETFNQQ